MSSLRTTSVSVMRPPKPPSWRDFVSPAPKSIPLEGTDVPDPLGRSLGARSPISELIESSRGTSSVSGNKASKLPRRPRAKIHRTRSEHVIDSHDLPEPACTATLAEADPKGSKGRRPVEYDCRLYDEENTRRCQSWLASIEACEPLDEVDYTSDATSGSPRITPEPDIHVNGTTTKYLHVDNSSDRFRDDNEIMQRRADPVNDTIPIHDLSVAVDVEVPEETYIWSVPREVRPPPSASSGEDCCCSCTMSTTFRGDDKKKATSTNSGIKICQNVTSKLQNDVESNVKQCQIDVQDQPNKLPVRPLQKVHGSEKITSTYNSPKPVCDVSNPTTLSHVNYPQDEAAQKYNKYTTKHDDAFREEFGAPRPLTYSTKRTSSQSVLCDTDLWALDQSD